MGLETVVLPNIENSSLLQSFISSVETSFDRMRSEASLKVLLAEMNLTEPLIKIDVALNKRIETDDDSDGDSDEDSGENVGESDNEREVIERPKCTLTIMPLACQIKQFFELPNVFSKIQSNTAEILAHPSLNHFIKGIYVYIACRMSNKIITLLKGQSGKARSAILVTNKMSYHTIFMVMASN